MKMMDERIREKQAQVDKLESALKSLNISISPVHMEFFPSPPVTRHRSVRRKEEGGMELLGERLFEGGMEGGREKGNIFSRQNKNLYF